MITDLESILHKAEATYLEQSDLNIFKSQIFSLEKRLQVYELLRERETEVFQYVANQLISNFSELDELKIRKALQHWILVVRHCGMAMLSDNHLYLQYRILEWLSEVIETHDLKVVEEKLYSLLQKRLQKALGSENFSVLEPFLEQSQNALLSLNQ
jgi:hypothetical protein